MKIETKFELDQEVFFIENNKVKTARIIEIHTKTIRNMGFTEKTYIDYRIDPINPSQETRTVGASIIFKSKQELLNTL